MCKPFPRSQIKSPETRRLVTSMSDIMNRNEGVGIAAPQVGVAQRVFILSDKESGLSPMVMFNPVVTVQRDAPKWTFLESCLSIPEQHGKVTRDVHVDVQYLDEESELRRVELFGVWAIIAQHELDHLNGVLFTDRVPRNSDGTPQLWSTDYVLANHSEFDSVLPTESWLKLPNETKRIYSNT